MQFIMMLDKNTGLIDYESVERLALEHKPKILLLVGALIQE